MNTLLVQCPKCRIGLLDGVFNRQELAPCPNCDEPLQVELFPAYFRPVGVGAKGELVLTEGESTCFYHPQKKAAVPCDSCGRFLCSLCDCQFKGLHLCPTCLETGQKKKRIQGMEGERTLYHRQALMMAIVPLYITGFAAIYMALRYRREPGSIVQPIRWWFPLTMIFASLQVLGFTALIVMAFLH
jgi:hypothetical protein